MNNQTYKILAKHFAETVNLQLVFEKNATPSTNGETIFLPTELSESAVDLTLGALLHETAHIRYTDFNNRDFATASVNEKECANTLEDIRVDKKIVSQYPNSFEFQEKLIKHVIGRFDLTKEPLAIQVLKGLILKSHNYDYTTVYNKKTCTLVEKYSHYISLAENLKNSYELMQISKKLCRELMGEVFEPSKGGNQPNQNNQKENQQSQSGQSGSDNENNGNQEQKTREEKLSENYRDKLDEISQKEKKEKELAEKQKNLKENYKNGYDNYKSLRRKLKLNQTKAYRQGLEANSAENNQDPEAKDLKNKLDQRNKRVEDLSKEYKNQVEELKKMEYDSRKMATEKAQIDNDLIKLEEELIGITSTAFGKSQAELLGFTAIDPESLKVDSVVEIDAKPSFDELVKDALIVKKDQIINNDEGNKINSGRIHEAYCGSDYFFQDTEIKEHKTEIALVVDVSGSMGDYGIENEKLTIAFKTVKVIADALQKAINNGAPADFVIYGFGKNVKPLIDKCENYTFDNLINSLNKNLYAIGNSSTNLAQAVSFITQDLKQNYQDTTDRVCLIITDAEVCNNDLTEMINTADTDGAKFIYIAIQSSLGTLEAQKIFGDYNIMDLKSGAEILEKALLTTL